MSEPLISEEQNHSPTSILLVEDDSNQAKLFQIQVHKSPNPYEFTVADTAPKALELIANGLRPDIVITDYNLPGMNGLRLIETIRNNPDPSISSLSVVLHTNQPVAIPNADAKRIRELTGQAPSDKGLFAINLEEFTRHLRYILPHSPADTSPLPAPRRPEQASPKKPLPTPPHPHHL